MNKEEYMKLNIPEQLWELYKDKINIDKEENEKLKKQTSELDNLAISFNLIPSCSDCRCEALKSLMDKVKKYCLYWETKRGEPYCSNPLSEGKTECFISCNIYLSIVNTLADKRLD
jgi:hypothetical protein